MESILAKLYKEYFRTLYRFAVGLVSNVDEANDIVQNIFTRLAVRGCLNESIDKTYLFSAVRNGAKDFYKRKKMIPLSHLEKEGSEFFEGEVHIDFIDNSSLVVKETEYLLNHNFILEKLSYLTEEQKEIISLKYLSEFSNKEIAEILGKSENAVRQMEFRALLSLRKMINHK